MPEMFEACGQRFRVFKRAHKTCDPPNGLQGRRMLRAVHLEEFRCNGAAHGGCQAKCLVFWKEAWLKRVDGENSAGRTEPRASGRRSIWVAAGLHGTRRRRGNAAERRAGRTRRPNLRLSVHTSAPGHASAVAMGFAPVRGRLHIRKCAVVSIAGVVSILLVRAAGLSGSWLGNGRPLDLRHDPECARGDAIPSSNREDFDGSADSVGEAEPEKGNWSRSAVTGRSWRPSTRIRLIAACPLTRKWFRTVAARIACSTA